MTNKKNANTKANNFSTVLVLILTIIFVIAKLLGFISWSWIACFLPLIVGVGLTVIVAIAFIIVSLICKKTNNYN